MRKRPNKIEVERNFIEKSIADKAEKETIKEDMHMHVVRTGWPIFEEELSPSMAEGSNLRKTMTITFKEFEWNSVDRHTSKIGVEKAEWVRYAIFKLMQEEQLYFLKTKERYK